MLYLYTMKKKNKKLFDFLANYEQWVNLNRLSVLLKGLDTHSIYLIITKELYLNGIDTEEKIIELSNAIDLRQPAKVELQNCMRDIIISHVSKIEDIPSLPKFE